MTSKEHLDKESLERSLKQYISWLTPNQKGLVEISIPEMADLAPEAAACVMASPLDWMPVLRKVSLELHSTDKLVITRIPLIPRWTHYGEEFPGSEALDRRLIGITGRISQVSIIYVRVRSKTFVCLLCRQATEAMAEDRIYGHIKPPKLCLHRSPEYGVCRHRRFEEQKEQKERLERIQTCILIEAPRQSYRSDEGKRTPRQLPVVLLDPLIDVCSNGEEVMMAGVLGSRHKPGNTLQRDGEFFFRVLGITRTPRSIEIPPELGGVSGLVEAFEMYWRRDVWRDCRQQLVQAFAPDMHGRMREKLALLLTVIGGSSGRKQGHLMIIGQKCIGKTHLLRAACKLSSPSVYVTAQQTSLPGLTCAAVKESGGPWRLSPGAMAMADNGLCCIDNLPSLNAAQLAPIHEAMEQQRLMISKAGIHEQINTRCSIITSCQPKKPNHNNLEQVTGLKSPLLSRFDVILWMEPPDEDDPDHFSTIIKSMLSYIKKHSLGVGASASFCKNGFSWNTSLLRAYIRLVQRQFTPAIEPSTQALLDSYFDKQRNNRMADASRTTMRLRNSLIRLTEAHARLMAQEKATQYDAMVAILLADHSMYPTDRILPGDLFELHWTDPNQTLQKLKTLLC